MRFAFNEIQKRKEVSYSGERAKCPNCGSIVIGKCGNFKINHWAHKANPDCDNWHEPITDWHLSWQNLFPEECREVSLKNENNELHRADIRLKNGLVIEVQNSPISVDNIENREAFYGVNNMIWILNGENLLKHSSIYYRFNKKDISLVLTIPHYMDTRIEDLYNMDLFREVFMRSELMNILKNHKRTISFEVQNGNCMVFKFSSSMKFELLKREIHYLFQKTCDEFSIDYEVDKEMKQEIYPMLDFEFYYSYSNIIKDNYSHVFLHKKYWRKFIDLMKFPVFIDRLEGLEDDLIYWYQENKIIKKSDFITKYMEYT